MIDVSSATSGISDLDIRRKQETQPKENELGQTAFLELMITQLSNQDPLSPQDNGDFIAQLAQFSSVEGIQRLNENFDSFANNFASNRALQASSLVGSAVTVPGDSGFLLEGKLIAATAVLPATTSDLSVNIYTEAGDLIQQFPVGAQSAGDIALRWDGLNLEIDGEIIQSTGGASEPVGPGKYRFEITASQDGKKEELETAVSANVNSVSVEPDGNIVLNLAGIGAVNLSDVKQFN